MCRVVPLVLIGCLLHPVWADGEDDVPAASPWAAAEAWLLAPERMGPLDAEGLVAFSALLPGRTAAELEARAGSREVWQMPDPRREPLERALHSLAWLRRLGPHLEQGSEIALLLGEREGPAWDRALVELCREPFGEPLGRAAEILAASTHGPFRVMAGRIAKYLNAFCGGHGSAWGVVHRTAWDPTPLVRRIARRLLDDPNPAVACTFASYDAYDLEDHEIIDALVAHLDDERQMPRVLQGLLGGGEETVGEACLRTLHGQFHFYRKPDASRGIPARFCEPAVRRVTALPAANTAAAVRAFWESARDRWSFPPDGEAWRVMLDVHVVLDWGGEQRIPTPFGDVTLALQEYREALADVSGSAFTIDVDVDVGDQGGAWNIGNPSHHLGYVARSRYGSGIWDRGSLMFAPIRDGGVRMRVRIWTARTPVDDGR